MNESCCREFTIVIRLNVGGAVEDGEFQDMATVRPPGIMYSRSALGIACDLSDVFSRLSSAIGLMIIKTFLIA